MNDRTSQIVIIEDEPTDIDLIVQALESSCDLRIFTSGESALPALNQSLPDLILLDVTLPGLDGYAICRELKASETTRDIPIIFLTSRTASIDEERSLAIGAADFIRKPVEPSILRKRVQNQIDILSRTAGMKQQFDRLIHEKENTAIQNVAILLLTSMDPLTGGHIEKTSEVFSLVVHRYAERHPEALAFSDISCMAQASILHDIGKAGIPHRILCKDGPLDADEFALMQQHPRIGGDIIQSMETRMGQSVFLQRAHEMALFHHERWDGSGYPHGCRGRDIPLSARIMSLVDVYEALTSERSYRAALSHETAFRIITEGDGRVRPEHFDPTVLDAFRTVQHDLLLLTRDRHDDVDAAKSPEPRPFEPARPRPAKECPETDCEPRECKLQSVA